MSIHPQAIRDFIERSRDDHRWMKSLPTEVLDRELERLKFSCAKPNEPLMHHQKVCILLGIAYKAFPFWLDMGTGKTRTALELLRYWRQQGEMYIGLVLAPSESALIGWENQIKYWKIKIPYCTLLNSPSQEKLDQIDELDSGLILGTYPGLTRALSKLVKKKTGKRRKLAPHLPRVRSLARRLDAIVSDESTKLGNQSSLQFRLVRMLRKEVDIFYELAGRPFGRDPSLLWSQMFLIDRGETLGDTLGLFRAAFFTETQNYFGGYEYTFKKSMKRELNRILQHRSISYRADECIDLPEMVPVIEEVELPEETQSYYEKFVKKIKLRNASFVERKNAFIRMRQVSSGFVGFTDDETGQRAEISFAVNPKLDRLLERIEEIPGLCKPKGCKFVIFYEFTFSGRQISEALSKMKIKHGWLWGKTKNARELLDEFDSDDRTGGLIVNHKLGGYALNLQRANYTDVFEAPLSAIDDEQMRRRVLRQGQTRTVFETDYVCRGTADASILAFHREGNDLLKAVLVGDERALQAL